MNKSIYYIILDIGFTYEKGNSSKGVWYFREKNRINENNKERKYNFIRALHNLPKCMHGCNCIQSGFKPISYEDAIKYSSWV